MHAFTSSPDTSSSITKEEKQHHHNINSYYDSEAIQLFESLAQQQIHLGYWDEKYPNVSLFHAAQRLTNVVIDNISIPQHTRFLDIGCGCGAPAIEIAKQKKCFVEGITINPQQHQKAQQLSQTRHCTKDVNFTLGDANMLPYADQHFNGVLFFESIHHIGHKNALKEAHRVLKPNSQILIADGVVLKDKISTENQALLSDTFVSKSLHTNDEIISLLRDTGFNDIKVLDLTTNIRPTWAKLGLESRAKHVQICKEYGHDFFNQLLSFWQQMDQVWSESAQYLIITAKKSG